MPPVPITSQDLDGGDYIEALTPGMGRREESQLLTELHVVLNYQLLAHALPAEYFPVNYA